MNNPLYNPLYSNSNLQTPFFNSIQGLNIPVQKFKSEILNRINNSPFFKIIFEPRKCCENFIYISVYTLNSIDDNNLSNENENFLFKGVFETNSNLCSSKDFEIKCYIGPNFDSANEYFCTFIIQK